MCASMRVPFMRHHEKLVVSPRTYLFAWLEAAGKGSLEFLQHRFAGPRSVCLTQSARLIYGHPKNAERHIPAFKIFK